MQILGDGGPMRSLAPIIMDTLPPLSICVKNCCCFESKSNCCCFESKKCEWHYCSQFAWSWPTEQNKTKLNWTHHLYLCGAICNWTICRLKWFARKKSRSHRFTVSSVRSREDIKVDTEWTLTTCHDRTHFRLLNLLFELWNSWNSRTTSMPKGG